MVAARRGLGGPQPTEVRMMLGVANEQLMRDADWLDAISTSVNDQAASLRAGFVALAEAD